MEQQLSMFDAQPQKATIKQKEFTGINSTVENGLMHSVIKNKGQELHRHIEVGQKVDVYRNLNKPAYFSAKAKTGEFKNLVAGYAKCYILKDVSFFVGTGRLRVLDKGVKNVHAYVRGEFFDAFDGHIADLSGMRAVTYNPHDKTKPFFYFKDTGQLVEGMTFKHVIVQGSNVWVEAD